MFKEDNKFEKFKSKVFRYLYNRDNQQKLSIYKGLTA